jgi:hypothetical protein
MPSSDKPQQQSFDLDLALTEPEEKKEASNSPEGSEDSPHVLVEDPKPSANSDLKDSSDIEDQEIEPEIEESLDPDKNAAIESIDYIEIPSSKPSQKSETLSAKETREIVTPYAFTVSPDLLGQALASPTRRAVAILVDLFLIAVVSGISSLILAGFVALTFFNAGKRLKQQKRFNALRLSLRGVAALLIFAIVFTIISDFDNSDSVPLTETEQIRENEEAMRSLLDLAGELIDISCNANSECLLEYAEGVAIGAAAMDIPVVDINATTSDIVSQKEWSDENKSLFMDKFLSTLNEERNAYTDDVLEITQANEDNTIVETNQVYSIIEWVKGIMSDLGLGLGWAALYFSVFTAWWRGQTIGKKLLGIEVVKLDGNYPSLWESFGRYGGYGAGFATGLLGFLQIYWDPNRQAIQDKISETLVLRLKPKR